MRRLTLSLISLILFLSLLVSCSDKATTLENIPEFSEKLYVEINGNIPFFDSGEITQDAYEYYSPLDTLGRCGVAHACLGQELMPSEERDESLSTVSPSGWEYKGVSNNRYYESFNGYLYHRCHLIGFQLAGENANEKNLITGTGYFNVNGMLPFENMVSDYIEETDCHVMYRVTPLYDGYELVARGVLMEAWSVEDDGDGVCFCVFVYNVQPGIEINYFNGVSRVIGDSYVDLDQPVGYMEHFVLNKRNLKYHMPDCVYVENLKEENRIDFDGRLPELETAYPGCEPCGVCFKDD